jgi:isoleucyl-tRNA synthetase
MTRDKQAAYETLYTCLKATAQLMASFAPFFGDWLYTNLTSGKDESVHLTLLPKTDESAIDTELEARMELAEKFSSLVLSLRKKSNLRVRQPLSRVMIPVLDDDFRRRLEKVQHLLLHEVNVKTLEYVTESGVFVKKIKPNFVLLGKKLGKHMKTVAAQLAGWNQEQINALEQQGWVDVVAEGETLRIERSEVEILIDDLPGWQVASDGRLVAALDITLTPELADEGIARELVNRIQNLRKDKNFEVTDRISVKISANDGLTSAVNNNFDYICSETLATTLEMVPNLTDSEAVQVEVDEAIQTFVLITKQN